MSPAPGSGSSAAYVAPESIEGILFDLGGTCLAIDHGRVGRALASRGISLGEDWVGRAETAGRAALGQAIREGANSRTQYRAFWDGLFLGAGAPAEDLSALYEELEDYHRRHHLWSRVMPGMPEALRSLAGRGFRLAALSNSDGRAERLLGRLGLAQEFEFVVDSHDVGFEKPDPRIFTVACARFGLAPERCAYVGDTLEIDFEGARSAGLWPVLLDVYGAYSPAVQPRAAEPAQLLGLFPGRSRHQGERR